MMATRELSYSEGDLFGVPLPGGEWALGVVARVSPQGDELLGYFFGPRRDELPAGDRLPTLQAEDAALVGRCGDLGLLERSWPILGPHAAWRRSEWPMPEFRREDVVSGAVKRIRYDDDDPSAEREARPVDAAEAEGLPVDGLYGAEAVSRLLGRLLGVGERPEEHAGEPDISFYLYFPQHTDAEAATQRLQETGFEVELRQSADDTNWLALARGPLAEHQPDDVEPFMRDLAAELGGEYDGYERAARRTR